MSKAARQWQVLLKRRRDAVRQRQVFQKVVALAATVFSENIGKMHKIDEIPVFRNKTFSDRMNRV
jgi:hypothetical protein